MLLLQNMKKKTAAENDCPLIDHIALLVDDEFLVARMRQDDLGHAAFPFRGKGMPVIKEIPETEGIRKTPLIPAIASIASIPLTAITSLDSGNYTTSPWLMVGGGNPNGKLL